MGATSVSPKGMVFKARREAIVLVAYRDGGTDERPKYSIGGGHSGAKPGETITYDDALKLLVLDTRIREKDIVRYLDGEEVTQWEFDALASLYFQGGTGKLKSVIAKLPDRVEAARQFLLLGSGASGEFVEGIFDRRCREVSLFGAGDYGEQTPVLLFRSNPRGPHAMRESIDLKPEDIPV